MKDFAHTSLLSSYTLQTGIILKFLPHASLLQDFTVIATGLKRTFCRGKTSFES